MAGCKQVFSWLWPVGTTATSFRGTESGSEAWGTTAGQAQPWCATGDFRNLAITLASAPGVGKSLTVTLQINGADTALTVTISGAATSGSDTTHVVSVSDGDTVAWKRTTSGTPTLSIQSVTAEFNGATAGESSYGRANTQTLSTRNPLFNPAQWNTATITDRYSLSPAAGAVTKLSATLSVAPGAGTSRTLVIYKNGIKQDGAGGTVNTQVTIADGATAGSATFSLSVSPGDQLAAEWSTSGSPAVATAGMGVRFTATTDGYSIVCFGESNALNESTTRYHSAYDANASSANATESAKAMLGGISTVTLRDLYQRWSNTNTVTLTARKNSAGTPLTCATAASTTANDTAHTVSIASGDTFDFERAGTTGFNRTGWFSCVMQANSDYSTGGPGSSARVRCVSWGWG